MTRETDREFGDWTKDWQSAGTEADSSLDALRLQARGHFWVGVGNLGVGVTFLVVFTTLAISDPRPPLVAAAAAVWLFVLCAAGFDLWNRRRTWRIVCLNTREFIQLAHRQLKARMRGLQFAWGLLAAETAFFIPWIAWTVSEQENATARNYIGPYFFLAVFVLGFGVALISLQRSARRQLKGIRAIQDALDDENQESPHP